MLESLAKQRVRQDGFEKKLRLLEASQRASATAVAAGSGLREGFRPPASAGGAVTATATASAGARANASSIRRQIMLRESETVSSRSETVNALSRVAAALEEAESGPRLSAQLRMLGDRLSLARSSVYTEDFESLIWIEIDPTELKQVKESIDVFLHYKVHC